MRDALDQLTCAPTCDNRGRTGMTNAIDGVSSQPVRRIVLLG
jgi:hypothetical protein